MTSKAPLALTKQLAYLALGVILLWGLAVVPARFAIGDHAVAESAAAAGLCLLPACLTLFWSRRAGSSLEGRLLALVGGTGLRMMFVLAGGFALTRILPEWFDWTLWVWLMVFYIFTLGLETALLVKSKGEPAA